MNIIEVFLINKGVFFSKLNEQIFLFLFPIFLVVEFWSFYKLKIKKWGRYFTIYYVGYIYNIMLGTFDIGSFFFKYLKKIV